MSLLKPKWEMEQLNRNVEWDLYEQYVTEYADIFGISVDYYVFDGTQATMDPIYGEDPLASYAGPYRVKFVYQVTLEPATLDIFGYSSTDTIEMVQMPKSVWTRDMQSSGPKVNDVIKTVWNNIVYEVVDVGEESSIFQLKKFVWELILRPFRYSEQSDSADAITTSLPVSAYGTNTIIEEKSDEVDNYTADNIDTTIYGY